MSDSFAYSGDNAAEARRYDLNCGMIIITCRHQINNVRSNPAIFRTSLQIADDCRQRGRDDGLILGSVHVGGFSWWAHLVQRCQEGTGHEGCKHDGDVIVGQDMGLSLFPSSAGLCLLSACRNRSDLGFFVVTSHVPVPTVNWSGRGWENSSWESARGLINPDQPLPNGSRRLSAARATVPHCSSMSSCHLVIGSRARALRAIPSL